MNRAVVLSILIAVLPMSQRRVMAAEEQEEMPLGTVVVTATRTAVPLASVTSSISVISQQQIQNAQSPTVIDSLRAVPGVDVSQSGSPGSTASVFIRGADADQSLILIDGVEVNSATLGGFNFGNIMTDDIGRIEVLRGAGGALYGSEAVGGVVNIITQKGEGRPHLSLSSAGGNTGTSSQLGRVAGQSGIVSYSASLGYFTTAGFRPINDDFSNLTSAARVDVTPVEHGTLRAFWRSANSSLGLADNNIGNGYGDFLDPNARQHDEFYLAKGEWEHAPVENLTYRVSGAYSRTVNAFSDQIDPQVLTSPNFFGNEFFLAHFRVPNEIAVAETQANYSEGEVGVSTVGFEFKEKTGKLKSVSLDGSVDHFDHSRANYAGYAQQQLYLLEDRLAAVAGFRVDGNEDFGRAVSSSWSIGYVEDWGAAAGRWDTHVKGGYTEGFRAPTFNELFFPKSGNRNLDAETSSEYDGGVEQHLGARWLSIEGTYFARRTKSLIQFAPVAQCPGAMVPPGVFFTGCNVGRADVSGVEATLKAGPVLGISLRGSYTYLDWDLSGGGALLRRPHNRMAAMLNYRRQDVLRATDRFDVNVNVVFAGERHDLDPLTFEDVNNQPAYYRTDLALRYDVPILGEGMPRIGWFARISNLFDRRYSEVRGFRSPPLNVLAGGRLTF
jgi:vitamin B12 transporter